MKRINLLIILFLMVILNACADDDESTVVVNGRSAKAIQADIEFWNLIHGKNNYQNFNQAIMKLTEAQKEDPQDVHTIAHIGFANMWLVNEGIGLGLGQAGNIIQYLQDAEKTFSLASGFAPDEPRILGFLGYTRLRLGSMIQNNALIQKGQANVLRSIMLWPEWAHFGAAYGADSRAPYNSIQFEQALENYWMNLNACANTNVDRTNPDFFPYLVHETLVGRDRACWDSWIAPYNFEGFSLIMGDALVKAGNTDIALIIYNNAKLMKYYDSWPFRDLLERRISNVNVNVQNFRQVNSPNQTIDPETSLISNTSISCAVCHQGDADVNFEPPAWVGKSANEFLVPFE